MIAGIVNATRRSLRDQRDRFFFELKCTAIEKDWRRRFAKIYSLHPEYRMAVPSELERQHADYWKRFGKFSMNTLRVCYNIAGRADYRIVPEEIQAAIVERCLNAGQFVQFFTHKGYYELLYGALFPHVFFQRVDGHLMDTDLRPLDHSDISRMLARLPYPVVFKPSVDSSGGNGLQFPQGQEELSLLLATGANYVVQEMLAQHSFFRDYNAVGLNTLRVYVYRSVRDESLHVLNVAARFGRGGSLDNETAGGIVAYVDKEGRFAGYALDKYGEKHLTHPDSELPFNSCRQIPNFLALLETAKRLAGSLPMPRLIGFDFCLQPNLEWRCIEVNILGSTIRFAQYHGEPFYGAFTDEIIDYSLHHPNFNRVTLRAY